MSGLATAQAEERGCSSGVEHNLAKVGVEGSNPFARSKLFLQLQENTRTALGRFFVVANGLPARSGRSQIGGQCLNRRSGDFPERPPRTPFLPLRREASRPGRRPVR